MKKPSARRGARLRPPSPARTSLRVSVIEGVVSELVQACAGGAVLTAWALYLQMSAPVVGLLAALPFAAQALQLPSAWVSALEGNRRTALWTIGLSRQAPLVLCALPFLPLSAGERQAALIAVASVAAGLAVAGNNAWTGWMGELVPEPLRGRYFGQRGAFCALGAAVGGFCAGLALDRGGARGAFASGHSAGVVLAGLTLAGCVLGSVTSLLLARQHSPGDRRAVPRKPRLADAAAPFRCARARRLLAFQAVWSASSGLAAAFYPLHMVATLHMPFSRVALYNTALAGARMVSGPLWGRALDRRGARRTLLIAAFGLCVSPFIWLFVREGVLWPLAIDALLCGAMMSAQSLATFSLSLSVAEPQERSFHLAAFSAAGGLATGLGAAAGGLLLRQLPAQAQLFGLHVVAAQLLFLVGGTGGRFVAALLSLRILEPLARVARRPPDAGRATSPQGGAGAVPAAAGLLAADARAA